MENAQGDSEHDPLVPHLSPSPTRARSGRVLRAGEHHGDVRSSANSLNWVSEICAPKCTVLGTQNQRGKTMINKNNENGISAVVGVILMVSITIILAAVVASFMIGDAGNQKPEHFATVKAEHTGAGITMTMYKFDRMKMLETIHIKINDNQKPDFTPSNVGDSKLYAGPFDGRRNHVVAIGKFSDGVENIILDVYV